MVKKIVAIWVSLVMILGFMIIVDVILDITPTISGTIHYVNETGSGGAYTTIQDAINASNDGDTIFVYNGTYYENVDVNKIINLTGEDRDSTIIEGDGNADTVEVYVARVNISSLSVINSGSTSGIKTYFGSDYVQIKNCRVSGAARGIFLGSDHNTVKNNTCLNNGDGILLWDADYNTITDNNCSGNDETGINLATNCEYNTISNNNCSENSYPINGYGIKVYTSSHGNTIVNNICNLNNQHGIFLWNNCNNNILMNNTCNSNNENGIYLDTAERSTVYNNTFNSNNGHGVYLSSSNVTFTNNIVMNNLDCGISSYFAKDNIITRNNVSNNDIGFYLDFSSYNSITENNVSNNQEGFYLYRSSNNSIYHNDIINSIIRQAFDDRSDNYWDNGYPLGGNYWSDYMGNDSFKGPDQDIIGGDGIGDSPYPNIQGGAGAYDKYPLFAPYKPLENYTIVKQGWNLISVPLIQEEQNITRVLGSINSWYNTVQWYDSYNSNDSWKHHKVGKQFGNDLSELNETMGFWIHITQPGNTIFLYNGTQPTSNQTIPLHPGWNMVGYPSLTSYNRTVGLNNLTFDTHVDAIWTYNAATQKYKQLTASDNFEIGKGYYIHAKAECTWAVPL
jgi:parallel beta-helix repeat protein